MFAAFLDDPDFDPLESFHWEPAAPRYDIPCLCGATIDLTANVNVCPGCKAEYDRYGRLTKLGVLPTPPTVRR